MKYLFVIYPNKNFNVKIDLPIFYLNMKKQLQKETLLWNIPYRNKMVIFKFVWKNVLTTLPLLIGFCPTR
jgi:hypothetical protein